MIPTKDLKTETKQTGIEPVEKISFTAHFDAGDLLNQDDPVTRVAGIGPQLAALEKLVYPITKDSSVVGFVLDQVGSLIPDVTSKSTVPDTPKKLSSNIISMGTYKNSPS